MLRREKCHSTPLGETESSLFNFKDEENKNDSVAQIFIIKLYKVRYLIK